MSSSPISGKSAAICDSFTKVNGTASGGTAATSRYAGSSRDARVRPTRSRARFMSSGGSASALSLMISTAVPPRPNIITGPKVGSSATPRINSRAAGRLIIGWIMTPSICASGRARVARAMISAAALRTPSLVATPSTTPPTSDLCVISRDRIFTATARFCARKLSAFAAAASGLSAESVGTIGIA